MAARNMPIRATKSIYFRWCSPASHMRLMTKEVVFMTPGQPPFGKKDFAENSGRIARDANLVMPESA